jgi:nucleoside-diphosphate-sugar epimerase
LVTGNVGLVGSHLVDGFVNAFYAVRVLDGLFTGRLNNMAGYRKALLDFKLIA